MYPADFDADTGHLTLAEDGAYNRLLRLQWRAPGCKLPADMEWIFRKAKAVTAADQAVIASIIAEFFTRKAGRIFQARLHKEWVKSDVAHAKRVSAGSSGGSAKALKRKETESSNAVAIPKQPEPEPEPYKKEEDTNVSSVVSRSKPADDCLAHFNAVAARVGWPQVQKITPARRAALSQRISDVGGEDAWRQAIDRAARSPHLTGQNNRGWVADFDWLTKAANFTKLMEGNYDPRTSKQPNQPHPANGRSDRIDPALEQIARLTGFATAPGSGGGGVGSAGEETGSLWLGTRPQ